MSGFSGVGKDEVANRLVEAHDALHFGLVDAAKRHMADLYGFSRDQLFGPSEMRNAGDGRYPKVTAQEVGASPYGEIRPCEKVVGDVDPGTFHWMCEGRFEGRLSELLDDCPYIPLRLGNARHLIPVTNPEFFLSPREVLQKYCALMQDLFETTWPKKAVGDAISSMSSLLNSGDEKKSWTYDRMSGNVVERPNGRPTRPLGADGFATSCFSDFRHHHEIEYVSRVKSHDVIPVLVRIKRPGIESPPFNHRSEIEQATIPDSEFDFVVHNDGDLNDLKDKVDSMVKRVKKENR